MKDISINKQMCKHVYIIIIIIILACIQVHMLTLLVIACNQNWPCFFLKVWLDPNFVITYILSAQNPHEVC